MEKTFYINDKPHYDNDKECMSCVAPFPVECKECGGLLHCDEIKSPTFASVCDRCRLVSTHWEFDFKEYTS